MSRVRKKSDMEVYKSKKKEERKLCNKKKRMNKKQNGRNRN